MSLIIQALLKTRILLSVGNSCNTVFIECSYHGSWRYFWQITGSFYKIAIQLHRSPNNTNQANYCRKLHQIF